MECPICQKRQVRRNNKTCGDALCVVRMTQQTRETGDIHEELRHQREFYGDDNPCGRNGLGARW